MAFLDKFIAFYDETGRINSTLNAPITDEMLDMCVNGDLPYVLVDGKSAEIELFTHHYVENGEVKKRPIFNAPSEIHIRADGQDAAVIDGLPDPCRIRLDDEEIVVTGGSVTLTSDMPAEYCLELVEWPYVEHTVMVIADAA